MCAQLQINGQPYAVDANGQATYTPATPGSHTLVATVSDGYETATATVYE